jgi:hypothetical protein
MTSYFVRVQGDRPPFSCLAYFLWGTTVNFDSDGNASSPSDRCWTELTVINRAHQDDRVDVDPVSDDPLILKIEADSLTLAARAAFYLAMSTNGTVAESLSGPYTEPQGLVATMGDFDVEHALWQASYG